MNKKHDSVDDLGRSTITCEVVLKDDSMFGNSDSSKKEYYIRRSIQDYYIKFSESEITEEEITERLRKKENYFIKMLSLTVAFKEGYWDDDLEKQTDSRKGPYVVLYK